MRDVHGVGMEKRVHKYTKCTECDGWHRDSLGHGKGLRWSLYELEILNEEARLMPGHVSATYMLLYEAALAEAKRP